jgi:hypothetical protein
MASHGDADFLLIPHRQYQAFSTRPSAGQSAAGLDTGTPAPLRLSLDAGPGAKVRDKRDLCQQPAAPRRH